MVFPGVNVTAIDANKTIIVEENPKVKISFVTQTGEFRLKFNQKMIVPIEVIQKSY